MSDEEETIEEETIDVSLSIEDAVKQELTEEFGEFIEDLEEAKGQARKIVRDIASIATPKLLNSNPKVREQGIRNLRVLNTQLAALLSVEATELLLRIRESIDRAIQIAVSAVITAI